MGDVVVHPCKDDSHLTNYMSMAQIYEDSLEKVGEEYGPLSLQMEDKLKEVFINYLHMQDGDKVFIA
jgi:hypothetical protein